MTKKTDVLELDAEEVIAEREAEAEVQKKVNYDLLYPKIHFSVITAIPVSQLATQLPAFELGVSRVAEQGNYRVVNSHVSNYIAETAGGKETVYSVVVVMERD